MANYRGLQGARAMAGWVIARARWPLLVMVAVLSTTLVEGAVYSAGICFCADQYQYDDTLKAELAGFTSPPTLQDNQYHGILQNADNVTFSPCTCTDVTRVEFSVLVRNATQAAEFESGFDTQAKKDGYVADMKSTDGTLQFKLISMTTSTPVVSDEGTTFKMEFLLKGRNPGVKDQVTAAWSRVMNLDTTLNGVETSDEMYTVKECATDPPNAPTAGNRLWSTGRLPSAEAVYTCFDRYIMSTGNTEQKITCLHDTLTWEDLPVDFACNPTVDKCAEDPPTPPEFTNPSWNNVSNSEGTVVNYICWDGYSPKNDLQALSRCESGIWSPIASSFECLVTGCLSQPPQVPVLGVLEWEGQRALGTRLTYTCKEGFKSNKGYNPQIRCFNLTWPDLPEDYKCVDEDTRLNLGTDSYAGYEENDMDYIWVVTVPATGGLVAVIIFCLCCTRPDSPLYNICGARAPRKAGYTNA